MSGAAPRGGRRCAAAPQGQLAAAPTIADPTAHDAASAGAAGAFSRTFDWALVLMVVCALPSLLLLRRRSPEPESGEHEDKSAPIVNQGCRASAAVRHELSRSTPQEVFRAGSLG